MRIEGLPELLAPAGNMEKLEVALFYGADAVYLGGKSLNLRAGGGGFTWEELDTALTKAHCVGAKVYYCLNSIIHDEHIPELEEALDRLQSSTVDGLIIADPGILRLAKQRFPNAEIHLSTQANTVNRLAIEFWKELGVHRINVARELNIKELKELRKKIQGIELEVFVHGAMCMAISGQCFMSKWVNEREANLGECSQPCRFSYSQHESYQEIPLFEERRSQESPNPMWFLAQEDSYSALLASEDLCLLEYVPWFIKNNIDSLKLEGRMKSVAYLAYAVNAYKSALLDAQAGIHAPEQYIAMLYNHATRPLSTGFFLPQGREMVPNPSNTIPKTIVARVEEQLSPTTYRVSVRQPWNAKLPVELFYPQKPPQVLIKYALENSLGERLECVHPGMQHTFTCESEHIIPVGILLQQ